MLPFGSAQDTTPGMELGQFIKERLEARGLTHERYAARVGVLSKQTISRIIYGLRTPPLNKLRELMKPLKLSKEETAEFRFLAGAAHITEELLRAELIAVFYREREHNLQLQRLNALIDSERLGSQR